jgi:hypothetical protein
MKVNACHQAKKPVIMRFSGVGQEELIAFNPGSITIGFKAGKLLNSYPH